MAGRERLYFISVAAHIVGMHAQTLRKYERLGLIEPPRTAGRVRLYSDEDLDRLRQIKYLVDEVGVNLAGLEIALRASAAVARLRETLRARLDCQQLAQRLEEELAELESLLMGREEES